MSLGSPELDLRVCNGLHSIRGSWLADVEVGARVVYERTSARELLADDGRELVIVRHSAVWAELAEGVHFDPPRGNQVA